MRLFAKEFYKMRLAFETMGRPPFPHSFDEALQTTTALVGQPTTLEQYLRGKGY